MKFCFLFKFKPKVWNALMETHLHILAWKIPSTEEPGGLRSMELQRVVCTHMKCLFSHSNTIFSFFFGYYFKISLLFIYAAGNFKELTPMRIWAPYWPVDETSTKAVTSVPWSPTWSSLPHSPLRIQVLGLKSPFRLWYLSQNWLCTDLRVWLILQPSLVLDSIFILRS